MQITFKLIEIASNIFSKSTQLKDLYLTSLTKGFNLNINIYESISNNLFYHINYKGISNKIKICIMKGKICIGIGQILISNKKQKIEIYPETCKNISKKIKLIILCNYTNNNKNTNDKLSKSPDRTSSNTNNFNNCNTNNTSTLSLSSCVSQAIQNKIKPTPLNQISNKNKKDYRNKSQTTLVENARDININKNKNKRVYIGLRQNNIYMHDKISENSTIFSERTKRYLTGNVSLNSYFSENNRKNRKKIFSPKTTIYSNNLYNENINDINCKKKNKNNSMIIYNENKNKNNYNNIFKFSNEINMDNINNQIEKYIMDKSFEDEVQNDVPLIYPQEKKKILYKDNFNGNKFEMLLNDFLLLYNNDNIKNFNNNEMELEFHFFVEKIYELINEYYKEYKYLYNQKTSLINNIKFFVYQNNNLLKQGNALKIKLNKRNAKNIFEENKNKDNKYYFNNIKKINNELDILKNINLGLINKNIKKESSKHLLKNIFSKILSKNKSHLNENQIIKLKKINIKVENNETKKCNNNKNNSLNYTNKRSSNNNIYYKYQNSKKKTTSDNIYKKIKNSNSKENKMFANTLNKIRVKTKYINS